MINKKIKLTIRYVMMMIIMEVNQMSKNKVKQIIIMTQIQIIIPNAFTQLNYRNRKVNKSAAK